MAIIFICLKLIFLSSIAILDFNLDFALVVTFNLMRNWDIEIKNIEEFYSSLKGKAELLEKELNRLLLTIDDVAVLLHCRRVLELMIIEICETKLNRKRGTEPLEGIIDRINKDGIIPEYIIISMKNLNRLGTLGAHPKDFNINQVKEALISLSTIMEWYVKDKGFETIFSGISNKKEEDETLTIFNKSIQPNILRNEDLIGFRIGNYVIENFIGSGGFGVVFKARHEFLLNKVAIKITHKLQKDDERLNSFFLRNVRGLSYLKHENIAQILEFGETVINGSKRYFIIMELVKGLSLKELVGTFTNKSQVDKAVLIFKKICHAVECAHNLSYFDDFGFQISGIYHGDIKPSNIIIRPDGNPILLDFMLVDVQNLLESDENHLDNKLSDADKTCFMGTPGYMAPEQAEEGRISIKTEVYSLGVLLFEMLFSSDKHLLNEFFEKDSGFKKIHNLNPIVPKSILEIIKKCVSKNPDQRYKDVSQILSEIDKTKNTSIWHTFFKRRK